MIHVYGLSYYLSYYIEASIRSIVINASEPIYLTVVDNKSSNSEFLRSRLISYGWCNRVIGMKDNSRGNALIDMVREYPPDDSEDFFVITDLDILVSDSCDWIKELRECRAKGANIAGFNLSLENYVPPNRGHDTTGIGWWLMLLDKNKFFNLPKGVAYTDHYLIGQLGPLHRAKSHLYHQTWDVWKDYPEYWDLKEKGVPWHEYKSNQIEEIYEKRILT